MSDTTVLYTESPPPAVVPGVAPRGVAVRTQAAIHILVGAPFGDNEFDIGKSVRWLSWFSSSTFILDVNLGTQRYWVIDWTASFPKSMHYVTGINYFVNPVGFRMEQWTRAQQQIKITNNDWVLWVDGVEGLSVDNRDPLPTDYDVAPFTSFLWRAIDTAVNDRVYLPFYVFLRSDEVQNASYNTDAVPPGSVVPPLSQTISTPFYLDTGKGLCRLMKASVLRDPTFNWATIDQLAPARDDLQTQIISYAYAHWAPLHIPPGETEVPPLTEANDRGWEMRKSISKVRPIPGLGFTTWDDGASDPVGEPGPWVAATVAQTNPDLVITPDTSTPSAPQAALEPVTTPLYDQVIRMNLRDGLWYVAGASGNIPVRWDSDTQTWISDYDPDLWANLGVASGPPVILNVPVLPQLSDVSPNPVTVGTLGVRFILVGSGFTNQAVAVFDTVPMITEVLNPETLAVFADVVWPVGQVDVYVNDVEGVTNTIALTVVDGL